jgi:hypothetical protein
MTAPHVFTAHTPTPFEAYPAPPSRERQESFPSGPRRPRELDVLVSIKKFSVILSACAQ